jgi:anaerobic magnesium-protoporphyrin IX monomethyl ester cyclase
MKILLINVPHIAIGSRIPREQLPPLGLLCIGGPLIDNGHQVKLLDGEFGPTSADEIAKQTVAFQPDAILMGHSGSTSAQPIIEHISKIISVELPNTFFILGGVFPTYHSEIILAENEHIDIIVRGEAEETIQILMHALEKNSSLVDIRGITYRNTENEIIKNLDAPIIKDLDANRIGWELMKPYKYSYWGNMPAVVVQFSRGCPYPCNYCGQSLFWKKWRYRNPQKFAAELAMLYREYGVTLINFADENPTTNKKIWKEFLLALIEEDVPLILVGSTRADNIVRDADILHLYKKAGVIRFLMGIETYDEEVQKKIKKAGTSSKDKEAIQLLRKHDIISLATYVFGFYNETDRDYYKGFKQLMSYDPDQIQMLYVTPHHWTPFNNEVLENKVIQLDQRKWDYKHQVIKTNNMKPWRVLLWVKMIEVLLQMRPKAIFRSLFHKDAGFRHGMKWYYRMGRRVWFHEVFNFFFIEKRTLIGPKVKDFWKLKKKKTKCMSSKDFGPDTA